MQHHNYHHYHLLVLLVIASMGSLFIYNNTRGALCRLSTSDKNSLVSMVADVSNLSDTNSSKRVSVEPLLNARDCFSDKINSAAQSYTKGILGNSEFSNELIKDDRFYSLLSPKDIPTKPIVKRPTDKSLVVQSGVISEIQFSQGSVAPENTWFELYNSTPSPLDMSGWTIKITNLVSNSTATAVLPQSLATPSGALVVICKNKSAFISQYSTIYDGAIDCIESNTALPTAGRISIFDTTNALVDQVCYNSAAGGNIGNCSGWAEAFPGGITSADPIEFRDPSYPELDNNNAYNWRSSLVTGGTPGYRLIRGDVNLSGTITTDDIDLARSHILHNTNLLTNGTGTTPSSEYTNFPALIVKSVPLSGISYTNVPLVNYIAYFNGGHAATSNLILTTYDMVQISKYILNILTGATSDHAFDGAPLNPVMTGYAPSGSWVASNSSSLPPFDTTATTSQQRADTVLINGIHHAAYISTTGLKIAKLVNNSWVDLPDPGFASTLNFDLTYDSSNNPVIVNMTNGSVPHTVEAKKFDGTTWQPLGATITSSAHHDLKVTRDSSGSVYVATTIYQSCGSGYQISVWKLIGTTWTAQGTPCINVNAARIELSVSDTIYVGYEQAGNSNNFYIKKLSGNQWVDMPTPGQQYSIGSSDPFDIEFYNGTMYIAMINTQKKLEVKKWNGTAWVTVGNISNDLGFTGFVPEYKQPRLVVTGDALIVAAIFHYIDTSNSTVNDVGFAAQYVPGCQSPWYLLPGSAPQAGFANNVDQLGLSMTGNYPTVHYRNSTTDAFESQQFILN